MLPHEFPWEPVIVRKPPRGLEGRVRDLLRGKDDPSRDIAAIERFHPRLIHAHMGWEGYRNLGLRKALGVPMIVTFYGLDAGMLPRRPWWRLRYRELFRAADRFIVEGPALRDRLLELGAPAERTRVVALGIDLARIRFRPRSAADAPRILMAASFREKKGHRYAVEAFQYIARRFPASRLEFVGDGPLRADSARRIPSDLAPRVAFHGPCSYDRYLQLLDEATVLLAPSVTARNGDAEGGAPVCLLEGQASGIPIVATTHCDIPNVIHPAGKEFLVPERDPRALADALGRLLESPARWAAIGAEERRWAEGHFDIRKQVKAIADVYRELLA